MTRRLFCCGYRRPSRILIVCIADNLSHALHIHWERLCDAHDRIILGDS